MSDWSDPIVRQARGIVFDLITGETVIKSFDKFFNYNQNEWMKNVSEDDETAATTLSSIKTKENKGKLTLQVVSIDENGNLDVSVRQGLLEAREIFLVVTGSNKREVVEKLYNENGKSNFEPADLKAHRMVNVILDKEAAAGLPEDVKEYFTARFA